jgi:anti-anti-sigma factor
MPQVTHEFDHRFPIAVIRLAGQLTAGNAPEIRAAMLATLVEESTSVIVDLARLDSADPAGLEVFPGVAARSANWPGTAVMLCGANPSIAAALRRSGSSALVGVYPSFAAALAMAAADPVPLRMRRRLEPSIHAPRLARELAAEACTEWNLPSCIVPTEILASELVTNAVRHAATTIDLQFTRRAELLRVSVHDRDRQMARLQSPTELDDHGRGLLIVNSVADRWGTEPITGGKVVWAALRVAPRPAKNLVDADR